jgi:hypothetical protein
MELTTLANVKSFLGKDDTTDDAFLSAMILSVSAYIESATNRKFDGTKEIIEIHDGQGYGNLVLRHYPVLEVTSVEYNNSMQSTPNWVVIPAVNYVVNTVVGTILGMFPAFHQNVRVTYKAGFTQVPFDLSLLATQLVAKEFEQRHAQGKANERFDVASVTWLTELTPMQKDVLDNYLTIAV